MNQCLMSERANHMIEFITSNASGCFSVVLVVEGNFETLSNSSIVDFTSGLCLKSCSFNFVLLIFHASVINA